ncbi:MAG: RHS repeat domain-containing protein [Prevotella fusca]|uniref:RHS repeat domain-containing protein n=1 Tax=Prevotella fusca TaxID=589436 RepID=UPI003F9EE561
MPIVSDHLGTPLQAFDNNGNKIWEQELDIFGRKRTGNNKSSFIPFKYQGQYEDVEMGRTMQLSCFIYRL